MGIFARIFTLVVFLGSAGVALAAPLALGVTDASVNKDAASGGAVVNITLTADSSKAFVDFTAAHVGKKIEVRIDGRAVMTPVLRDPIRGGVVQISGEFDRTEWMRLADRLKSGESRLEVDAVAE